MRIVKWIFRILFYCLLGFIGYIFGLMKAQDIKMRALANIAANSYVLGCVHAKVGLLGQSEGLFIKQCSEEAAHLYKEILQMNNNPDIEYGQDM